MIQKNHGKYQKNVKELMGYMCTCLMHSLTHSAVTDCIPHMQAASYLGPLANLHSKWVTLLVSFSVNLAPRVKHRFFNRSLSLSSYWEMQNRVPSNPASGILQGNGEKRTWLPTSSRRPSFYRNIWETMNIAQLIMEQYK